MNVETKIYAENGGYEIFWARIAVEIFAAYRQISSYWGTEKLYNQSEIKQIIQIENAYQLLSNNDTRRNYDYFNIDDLQEDVAQALKQYEEEGDMVEIRSPIFGKKIFSTADDLTMANFGELVMQSSDPWLIQIFSHVNPDSRRFSPTWDKIVELLEGVVRVERLELSQLELALIFAERNWLNGYPFFRNGLLAIVAVPPACNKLDCIKRYYGEKTADAVSDWIGSRLLKLPRIMYHSAQTLVTDVIQKPGMEKFRERAAAYMRKAAKDYWQYAVFAMVLWRENEAKFWETKIGVETAPALVFMKDPGVNPVIFHGKLNSSTFLELMEKHKTHELPQLRSISATSLGCDAAGHSLAGYENMVLCRSRWEDGPCSQSNADSKNARPVREFSFRMLQVLRGVQVQLKLGKGNDSSATVAIEAYREKRLRLAWLDGEIQKDFCYFYLNSESMFEVCGPRKYEIEDRPKIFLIRYLREVEENEVEDQKKRWLLKTTWEIEADEEKQYARQLVTTYNNSLDVAEIVAWVANMVYQGDSQELPSFRGKSPDLVPEESAPFVSKTQEYIQEKKEEFLQKGQSFLYMLDDFGNDPKFTPIVLLFALVYATAWLISTRYKIMQVPVTSTDSGEVASDSIKDKAGQPSMMEGYRRKLKVFRKVV
ncbi:hypothetical protein R1sor_021250 [Riccia sorocarpa]|uniref:Thioredoxin domain-containing protein n=1 Tax=Riccia sorocarpa TaxID=122646 RepID=A0ABD3GKQ9_9MARC